MKRISDEPLQGGREGVDLLDNVSTEGPHAEACGHKVIALEKLSVGRWTLSVERSGRSPACFG